MRKALDWKRSRIFVLEVDYRDCNLLWLRVKQINPTPNPDPVFIHAAPCTLDILQTGGTLRLFAAFPGAIRCCHVACRYVTRSEHVVKHVGRCDPDRSYYSDRAFPDRIAWSFWITVLNPNLQNEAQNAVRFSEVFVGIQSFGKSTHKEKEPLNTFKKH
jgi:hypothetical protein